jgi:hypothetical protein
VRNAHYYVAIQTILSLCLLAAAANLAQLVKSASIERLQDYLSSPGVDVNDRPGNDEALLDYAAEQNQAPVARFLIEPDARVDATQKQGTNAGFPRTSGAGICIHDALETVTTMSRDMQPIRLDMR